MKNNFIKFAVSFAASIGLLSIGAMGVAGASSISNTGPGSSNYVSGNSGSISTTGPGSVNVIGGHSSGCWNKCNVQAVEEDTKKDCDKKDDPKPVVKHKVNKWCWQNHHWCLRQVEV
jgi:hypothetical protein